VSDYPSAEQLAPEIVRVSHALHANGWVANHDGNVTAALGEGRYLATPTAVSKAAVQVSMLIVVNGAGEVLEGSRGSFSEIKLHMAAYRSRGDVRAVLHAHPPIATAFAVAGRALGEPFMAEPIVSLGAEIPLVPFGLPGEKALDASIASALERADAVMLGNHGVITVGPDLDTCLLRMELVEHMCKIALAATQLGGTKPLPHSVVQKLSEKHAKLFPREILSGGRGGGVTTTVARTQTSKGDGNRLVQEALRKLL
jgi:L-fuculose-phosphate aldolase